MRRFIKWLLRVLSLAALFGIAFLLYKFLGKDSPIFNFYIKKVLFTPYNIVGIFMVIAAVFGVWFGSKRGRKFFRIISKISLVLSAVSFLFGAIEFIKLPSDIEVQKNIILSNIADKLHIIGIIGLVVIAVAFVGFIIYNLVSKILSKI